MLYYNTIYPNLFRIMIYFRFPDNYAIIPHNLSVHRSTLKFFHKIKTLTQSKTDLKL